MPQIAPITLGSTTYGSPRIVKGGNTALFLAKDTVNGAIGDERLYVGEDPFSSTRAQRKGTLRLEHVKVGVNPATGAAAVTDRAAINVEVTHGNTYSESELDALCAKVVAGLTTGSYPYAVLIQRDGQF